MATLIWPVRVIAMSGSWMTLHRSFHSSGGAETGPARHQYDPEPHVLNQSRQVGVSLDDIGMEQDDLGADFSGDCMCVADHASRQRLHVASPSRRTGLCFRLLPAVRRRAKLQRHLEKPEIVQLLILRVQAGQFQPNRVLASLQRALGDGDSDLLGCVIALS